VLGTVVANVAGAVLIVTALRDVFDVLFNETTRGVLAHIVTRGVWRVFRVIGRRRRSLFQLAGPFAVLAVVTTWGLLLIVGWALVFLPHMPEAFNLGSGVDPSQPFVDALYTSMTTLSTVGFGDVSPATPLLRVLTPLEALLGFGLLTASISWLLSIYPVLSRRRSLAYEVNLLASSQEKLELDVLDLGEGGAEGIYSELISRLVAVERDMATFPVAYYFASSDARFELSATMPKLLDLAERGAKEGTPDGVRLRATMLREAIDDFAQTLSGFHGVDKGETAEMIAAYKADHLR
jgi:hypothetical protein